MPSALRLILLAAALLLAAAHAVLAATGPQAVYVDKEGRRLTASFDNTAGTVRVTLPEGRALTLPQALSGSGARYSDGRDTFWEHHGEGTFLHGEEALFIGRSLEPKEEARLREAATRALAAFRKTDPALAEAVPPGGFECELDAGGGKAPLAARCDNRFQSAYVMGALASVRLAPVSLDPALRSLPVLSDGGLCLLLRRDQAGRWRGVSWFLGSDQPALGAEELRAAGLKPEEVEAVGWTVEQD